MINSVVVKVKPTSKTYLTSFKNDAPAITGIARKKVNSAATLLFRPKIKPPIMVAPLRDVPGINDNNWNNYSFYVYILPFNNAKEDRKDIMKYILG